MANRYGGRPHWGKAYERVFKSSACPIRDLYPHFGQQLQLQKIHDPAKLFETAELTAVIAGGEQTLYPACTNEMICYCQKDEHCGSPGQLFCKTASAPLPPYRICLP